MQALDILNGCSLKINYNITKFLYLLTMEVGEPANTVPQSSPLIYRYTLTTGTDCT